MLVGAAHVIAAMPGCITLPDQGGIALASGTVATSAVATASVDEKARLLHEERPAGVENICG